MNHYIIKESWWAFFFRLVVLLGAALGLFTVVQLVLHAILRGGQ